MIVLPQEIKGYLSTNVDTKYQQWDESIEYDFGVKIIYENRIYQSVVPNNKGIKPDLNTGKWLLFGSSNAYAAIDLHASSETVVDPEDDYIEFVFGSVGFTYLAFGSVRGSALHITQYDASDNELKDDYIPIGAERICAITWYDYYYCGIPDQSDLGRGRPIDYLYSGIQGTCAKIRVRIEKNSEGVASVRSMVGGKGVNIGETLFGTSIELLDYSIKETDQHGITQIVKRDSRERMECTVITNANNTQAVKRAMRDALGTVLMFIADPTTDSKYDNLLILGYLDSYETTIVNSQYTEAIVTIEEVL